MTLKNTEKSSVRSKKRCNSQFADFFGKLRYRAGQSRNDLVAELHTVIDPKSSLYKQVSDQLIKGIENGTRVKISCELLEALCKALKCTRQERAKMFLYAGHNVLVDDTNEPDDVAEMLHNIVDLLNTHVHGMLNIRLDGRHVQELDDKEQCELVLQALRLLQRHLERG